MTFLRRFREASELTGFNPAKLTRISNDTRGCGSEAIYPIGNNCEPRKLVRISSVPVLSIIDYQRDSTSLNDLGKSGNIIGKTFFNEDCLCPPVDSGGKCIRSSYRSPFGVDTEMLEGDFEFLVGTVVGVRTGQSS